MSEPLGNGEIADAFERVLYAAVHTPGRVTALLQEAEKAIVQLRRDTRALRAKQLLEWRIRALPWLEATVEQRAVNDAYIVLNWDIVPPYLEEYVRTRGSTRV